MKYSEVRVLVAKLFYFVAALALTLFGISLAYLGFVMPGLLWCSNFVSNEMISLVFCVFVGTIGVILCLFAFIVLLWAVKY